MLPRYSYGIGIYITIIMMSAPALLGYHDTIIPADLPLWQFLLNLLPRLPKSTSLQILVFFTSCPSSSSHSNIFLLLIPTFLFNLYSHSRCLPNLTCTYTQLSTKHFHEHLQFMFRTQHLPSKTCFSFCIYHLSNYYHLPPTCPNQNLGVIPNSPLSSPCNVTRICLFDLHNIS